MAEITAALVKELREITDAPMMDCKKALGETKGDMNAAIDWLRKKGLAAAQKKAGRVAAEGLVGVQVQDRAGALVEINAETDFVARNQQFQELVAGAAKMALSVSDIAALNAATAPGEKQTLAEKLTQAIATIGENMNLRRMQKLTVKNGIVASYMHAATAPNLGKIGVLVALESEAAPEKLVPLGRQLAMHIAAANPQSLTIESVDPQALERERAVLSDQARQSGKPEEIVAKMVEGRVRKYYEDVVLLEQVYVIDGESRVKQVLANAAKELGAPVAIAGYCRMALGEGIQREEKDFAAEVAAQLK
ncbi:MAG TPA: translation elongation factor Ts [Dongiaceae bacterium]|jgi:elongation factor Ts|nr:translation elongation factor Ts [Dongiaceae bacterium]